MYSTSRKLTTAGFLIWAATTMGLASPSCGTRLGPVRATQSAGWTGHANVPDIAVEHAKACVELNGRQLEPGRTVIESVVEVNEDGEKVGAIVGGVPETARDFGVCIRKVLQDMPIAEPPFREAVERLKFHRKHAGDSDEALRHFIEAIPGVPIVESELVLEADGYTIVLSVTVNVRSGLEKLVDLDKKTLAKIGQMTRDSVGYDEVMRVARELGWVKRVPVQRAQSVSAKGLIGDGPLGPNIDQIVKESFKQVMTKAAPAALIASQADTPAPGFGDVVGLGILAVGLVAVGGIAAYKIITSPGPMSIAVPAPTAAPTPQVPPPPPPPLPPPPPPRETCEGDSELRKIIRCDDPKISHYNPWGEDAAFKNVVKDQGQGLKKSNRDDAIKGPCKGRGGFHINVLRRGDSVASIYGCNCCDDSSGKAIKKQRTETRKKY